MTTSNHLPVLLDETMQLLDPQPGETWIDCTTGAGGHAQAILKAAHPGGKVICIDQDATMLRATKERLEGNAVFYHANFDQLSVVLEEAGEKQIDGIIADLGVCSDQLDDPARGLTFQSDGPLDMRLDTEDGETAADLLERWTEKEVADAIWQFGEERHSRRIARKIVEMRKIEPLETTGQLAAIVRSCVPRSKKRFGTIDPATRTFQALRIAVNDELGALMRLLKVLPSCIRPGGRVGIISFHSLEDRLVKRAFADEAIWERRTRKPVTATEQEINANPRARSAKLRVAVRMPLTG